MASPGRRGYRHLVDEIRRKASSFRFFQAVRLLSLGSANPEKAETIPRGLRFGSPLTLSFPASEISEIETSPPRAVRTPDAENASSDDTRTEADSSSNEREDESLPLEMTVNFMGLTGPCAALPTAYTELLIERRHQFRDVSAHKFLNMFTHRAVSLFYQAWRKNRFYLPFEAGDPDGFSRHLLDIVGVGLKNLQARLQANGTGIPDRFLIHYAGLLSQKPVSPTNIAALVSGFFGIEAVLESYVGQWIVLPEQEQSALDSRPCMLGKNTFAGDRLWDRQNKLRLRIGPLDRAQFDEFMPGQPGLAALRELLQFCLGLTLDCDVLLILKREAIPSPQLDTKLGDMRRLGYSLWLNSSPSDRHAEEACFSLLGGST